MTALGKRALFIVAAGVILLAVVLMQAAPAALTQRPADATPTVGLYFPLIARAPLPTIAPTPFPTHPTTTPSLTPTIPPPTSTPLPLPPWLAYVNYYRALALLPPVSENATWSSGCWLHARYMVKNGVIEHSEDPGNAWYTPEGLAAAQSSNLMVGSSVDETDEGAVDLWMGGPFHGVGIVDPALLQVGFGSYREAIGTWQMGAALDVIRGRGAVPPGVVFPVKYPSDGMTAPLSQYPGYEWPDPLSSCSGYSAPAGAPVILQLGTGDVTPNVTAHSFQQGGTSLAHCVYDETSYTNPDANAQSTGRAVLGARDAIVLIPRASLTPGATYTVSITTNGQTYTWSFSVASKAVALPRTGEARIR